MTHDRISPQDPPRTPTTIMADNSGWQVIKCESGGQFASGTLLGYLEENTSHAPQFQTLPSNFRFQGQRNIELQGCWTAVILDHGMTYVLVTNLMTVRLMTIGVYLLAGGDEDPPICWTFPEILTIFQCGPAQPAWAFQHEEMVKAKELIGYVMDREVRRIPVVHHMLAPQLRGWMLYTYFMTLYGRKQDGLFYVPTPNVSQPVAACQNLPATLIYIRFYQDRIHVTIEYKFGGQLQHLSVTVGWDSKSNLASHGIFFRGDLMEAMGSKFTTIMSRFSIAPLT